jgi:ADP-ribose pyrophosphatase YjhB (NUDIX family)
VRDSARLNQPHLKASRLAGVTVDRSIIRVKAMLIAPNAANTAHAVSVAAPTAENPAGYHRLIGGNVELGESHRDTIRREVNEELGAEIVDLTFLTTIENIFEMNGVVGHEIVFIYSGRLDPAPAESGATLTEDDGSTLPVVWRSISGDGETVPLFPMPIDAWVRNLANKPDESPATLR